MKVMISFEVADVAEGFRIAADFVDLVKAKALRADVWINGQEALVSIPNPLARPIEDLQLSVRSFNRLSQENKLTIGDVVAMSENDLMDIRNLGHQCIEDIKSQLRIFGLELKANEPGL